MGNKQLERTWKTHGICDKMCPGDDVESSASADRSKK